jgi:hypothetical protein
LSPASPARAGFDPFASGERKSGIRKIIHSRTIFFQSRGRRMRGTFPRNGIKRPFRTRPLTPRAPGAPPRRAKALRVLPKNQKRNDRASSPAREPRVSSYDGKGSSRLVPGDKGPRLTGDFFDARRFGRNFHRFFQAAASSSKGCPPRAFPVLDFRGDFFGGIGKRGASREMTGSREGGARGEWGSFERRGERGGGEKRFGEMLSSQVNSTQVKRPRTRVFPRSESPAGTRVRPRFSK